ncbi:MAG: endonuclease/exonuclease/phosphatase family protein [Rhodocyclaceae bacterium]|nr:endonuclease/exonuclease/phosphatase family protein [Rhodocyclaceae bacterium]
MRILSWNIQWGRGADGRVDLDRTIERIRACGALDAICLQEVSRNWPGLKGSDGQLDGPARLAAAFPDHLPIFAPGLEQGDGQGGLRAFGNLMLLAGQPGSVFRRLLPAPVDPQERSLQRTCLEVVVPFRGHEVRLMTTHLEYYSVVQRQAQIEALRQIQLDAHAEAAQARSGRRESLFGAPPRPTAALVCGDFNFAPGSGDYAAMGRDAVWVDAWRRLHGDRTHAPTVGLHGAEWPDHPYCCDFAWVSPALADELRSIEVLADTAASDHQPVLVELRS